MEEIREIALAYYRSMPEEQQHNAYNMFLAMDLNGDGRVTIDEYVEIFRELGFPIPNPRFIRELDRNGDGILDFEEFVSLYYLLKSKRLIFCDGHGCGAFLNGLYFTCSHCFSNDQNTTYDLCSSCFNNRNYHHHHDAILDNFTLLRSMAACSKAAQLPQVQPSFNSMEMQQRYSRTSIVRTDRGCPTRSRMKRVREAYEVFQAAQMGLTIGNFLLQPGGWSQMGQYSTTQNSISALSAPGGSSSSAFGTIREVTEGVGNIVQLVNFAQNMGIDICSIM